MDDIVNIVILLLFILVPVISAAAKGIKGAIDRAREEQKRRERRKGPRTPARELREFVRPKAPPPRPGAPAPKPREGEKTLFEEMQEILGIPAVPEKSRPPRPAPPSQRPAQPPVRPVSSRPGKPEETLKEHLQATWGKGPKPTGVDRETKRFAEVVEEHRKEAAAHLKWDDAHAAHRAAEGKVRRKAGPILALSRTDLRRGVILAELLAPPLAMRAPGEGPIAPLFSGHDPGEGPPPTG